MKVSAEEIETPAPKRDKSSLPQQNFVLGRPRATARMVRRKVAFSVALLLMGVVLGVMLGLAVALGGAAALQILWNSVRG